MSLTRSCDLCAGGDDVQRYTLTRKVSGEGGQRSRSMGGLDLCLPCWKGTSKSNIRKDRELVLARRIFRGES